MSSGSPPHGPATATGWWSDGAVFAFGNAQQLGPPRARPRRSQGCLDPRRRRYWIVTVDGHVYTFGDAGFYSSLSTIGVVPFNPIVGLVPTSDSGGYWLVGGDGGIFNFGDAGFAGSVPGVNVHITNIAFGGTCRQTSDRPMSGLMRWIGHRTPRTVTFDGADPVFGELRQGGSHQIRLLAVSRPSGVSPSSGPSSPALRASWVALGCHFSGPKPSGCPPTPADTARGGPTCRRGAKVARGADDENRDRRHSGQGRSRKATTLNVVLVVDRSLGFAYFDYTRPTFIALCHRVRPMHFA